MPSFLHLPDSWHTCPLWWRRFTDTIHDLNHEADHRTGVPVRLYLRNEYNAEMVDALGTNRNAAGVRFAREEDMLAFLLKWKDSE